MKKFVLLSILAALASWYFYFGRTMTDQSVRAHYESQTELLTEMEVDSLCSQMSADYHVVDVTIDASGSRRNEFGKEQACKDVKEGLAIFRRLSNATRGLLIPSFDTTIKSVTLSDGGKKAVVEGVTTVMMGEQLVARSRFTEHLIRRNGKVLSLGGESKSWTYGDG